MQHISFQQARSAAWQTLQEVGQGHVYEPKGRSRVAGYFYRGQPDCFVGYVLSRLGHRPIRGYRNHCSVNQLMQFTQVGLGSIWMDKPARYFLDQLQRRNDCADRWGDAYDKALVRTYDRFPHLRPAVPVEQGEFTLVA